jgi:hypothetical protein
MKVCTLSADLKESSSLNILLGPSSVPSLIFILLSSFEKLVELYPEQF